MKYAYLPFSMIDDKIPGINSLQLHCFPELVKPGSEIIIKTGLKCPNVNICSFNFVLLQYGYMVNHVPHNHFWKYRSVLV